LCLNINKIQSRECNKLLLNSIYTITVWNTTYPHTLTEYRYSIRAIYSKGWGGVELEVASTGRLVSDAITASSPSIETPAEGTVTVR
jgi:hypothetical protein